MTINASNLFQSISWISSDMYAIEWPEYAPDAEDYFTASMTEAGSRNYGNFTLKVTAEVMAEALEGMAHGDVEDCQSAWALAMLTVPDFVGYVESVNDTASVEAFVLYMLTHYGTEVTTTTEGN